MTVFVNGIEAAAAIGAVQVQKFERAQGGAADLTFGKRALAVAKAREPGKRVRRNPALPEANCWPRSFALFPLALVPGLDAPDGFLRKRIKLVGFLSGLSSRFPDFKKRVPAGRRRIEADRE